MIQEEQEQFNIGTVKTFIHKKWHSASSLIKKQKPPHTCKVTVVTSQGGNIQLQVSDGTFMNEVKKFFIFFKKN